MPINNKNGEAWVESLYASGYKNVCADNELGALLQGLGGEYILPGPGGDPIRNPDVLPTGKNMHALDPQSIPTEAAVKSAKVVVDRLLDRQMRDNNGSQS